MFLESLAAVLSSLRSFSNQVGDAAFCYYAWSRLCVCFGGKKITLYLKWLAT